MIRIVLCVTFQLPCLNTLFGFHRFQMSDSESMSAIDSLSYRFFKITCHGTVIVSRLRRVELAKKGNNDRKRNKEKQAQKNSVGIRCLLNSGSGIRSRDGRNSGSGWIPDEHPRLYFRELRNSFLGLKYLNSLMRIRIRDL
jgi:hypothetical protein